MATIITLGLVFTLLIIGNYIFRDKRQENLTIKETVLAYAVYILLSFLFASYTGILQSGYHFVDDHEMYTFSRNFAPYGYWGTMLRWMQTDLHSRFRFTYGLIRITECYFFRDNYMAWHIFQTIIAASSLWLCYIFARRLKCPIWLSFGFSAVIFFGGGQSAVLWRLGPQECLGILIWMITLLQLWRYAHTSSGRSLFLCIAATIFLGGIKEAFLLILPMLPFILVYWKMQKDGKEITVRNTIQSFGTIRTYTITTYAVFVIDLLIIVRYVGSNNIGYAGIDQTYGLLNYLRGFYGISTGELGLYLRWSLYGCVFLLLPMWIGEYRTKGKWIIFWRKLWLPVLIFSYLMATQYVLYAKSGMYERYLLPSTYIISAFWLIFVFHLCRRLEWVSVYQMFAILMVFSLLHGVDDENRAQKYALDGQNTTAMVEFVGEQAGRNSKVVVDIDYEMDFSATVILQDKYQLSSVYNVNYGGITDGTVTDCYIADKSELRKIPVTEAEIYLGYPEKVEKLLTEYSMDLSAFDKVTFGNYAVYIH